MTFHRNLRHLAAAVVATFSLAFTAVAQDTGYEAMWPGVSYDASVPTHAEVLGYDVGGKISNYTEMVKYFEALAAAAPDRVKIMDYGRTWEGRRLIYVAISSAENIAKLADFEGDIQALSNPRKTSKAEADRLIADMSGSVWLGYGVHGNEISSTDAAMMTAYHLLAADGEARIDKIMDNTIVFIDPLQNPDGRTRFTSRFYATKGMMASDDRISAEHNEPWPAGRTNHYLFDMNRDWLTQSQPESKGRIATLNKYLPLVVIDLHEMGGDSSYYFAPAARPFNPHMTKTQISTIAWVGKNNAKYFDEFGFDYFTREVFDAFYPGYGDSWPSFYGALTSTYEVSSSRGELYRRSDGKTLTYGNTVRRHFVASISTAEAVADHREEILTNFYEYQVSAIAEGKANKKARTYIFPNTRDKAGNIKLATLMRDHGVEVSQTTDSFAACGVKYGAGAFVIDTAQPRGRFVRTVMEPQVDIKKDWLDEQERRRARKLNDQIYDVTAWSLPLMYNVDMDRCGKAVTVSTQAITQPLGSVKMPASGGDVVAYIVPWGDMHAGKFLTAALRSGLVVKSSDMKFTLEGTEYPAGSLIIERRQNSSELDSFVAEIAAESGADVIATDTSWVSDGPSFGSGNVVTMHAPKVAIAWDEPTSQLSAGNTRFVIEQQMGYPVTPIRTAMLGRANLSKYQVIILPVGFGYAGVLGDGGAENLKNWVRGGGVLITLGSATRYAASAGLIDLKREEAFKEEPAEKESKEKSSTVEGKLLTSNAELLKEIENAKDSPDSVAGVLANIEVDQEHWLSAGIHKNVVSMVAGRDIYAPIKLASGKNVAWFTGAEDVLASGYLWEENRKQLAYKPFMVHQPKGRGMVIAFTQEATYRAYMDGLNVMVMNAIFRGSAHARPLR